jgi:hypothetical protein
MMTNVHNILVIFHTRKNDKRVGQGELEPRAESRI